MVRHLLALLGLLLVLPPTALARPDGESIVGGRDATRPYPWQAYLEVSAASGTYLCGGTLIAARYVLTAGHCVTDPYTGTLPIEVNLAVGVSQVDTHGDLTDSNNPVPADHRYLHISGAAIMREPLYNEFGTLFTPDYDAAVIRLPRPAPDQQARLVRSADSALWAPGLAALATGFGVTDSGDTSDVLQEVSLPIAPDSTCGSLFGSDYRSATMLCAGDTSGRDTCQGDSGGPLTTMDHGQFVLVGITSWGDACGVSAAVYTRAGNSSINDWIRSIVPQVELTQDVAQPVAGQEVTFTATPTYPGGSYDHVDWDTNGDGVFDDAHDVLSVKQVLSGTSTVSVRASKASTGDAEVRSLTNTVTAAGASPVHFTGSALTVTEGQTATLTVAKDGPGAGSVQVTPHPETAGLGTDVLDAAARALTFGAQDASATVSFATADDSAVEGPETFRVDLGGHRGDLTPATPGSVIVTILDNDQPPPAATASMSAAHVLRVRKHAFRISVTTNYGGTLRASAKDRAGHVLARAASRTIKAGTAKLKLRLTARGRRALARHRRVKVTLIAVYSPPAGESVIVKRSAYLR